MKFIALTLGLLLAPCCVLRADTLPIALTPIPPTVFDVGTIKRLDQAPLGHVFTMRNDSAQPITLIGLAGVDRSLKVVVQEAGDHPGPMDDFFPTRPRRLKYVLEPGQTAHLDVTVLPEWLPIGPIHKTVQILVLSQDSNIQQAIPAATFEVDADILPAAVLSPSSLDFGLVPSGVPVTRTLVVTMDSRMLTDRKPPRLNIPYPVVTSGDPIILHSPPGLDTVIEKYSLTVSPDAPWGLLRGSVSLLPAYGDYDHPIEGASIPMQGEVIGDITPSPSEIDFGTLAVGKGAMQRVTLTGHSSDSFQGVKLFTGDAKYLTARLTTTTGEVFASTEAGFQAPIDRNLGRTAILELTLSPQSSAIGEETNVAIQSGTAHSAPVHSGSMSATMLQTLMLPVHIKIRAGN